MYLIHIIKIKVHSFCDEIAHTFSTSLEEPAFGDLVPLIVATAWWQALCPCRADACASPQVRLRQHWGPCQLRWARTGSAPLCGAISPGRSEQPPSHWFWSWWSAPPREWRGVQHRRRCRNCPRARLSTTWWVSCRTLGFDGRLPCWLLAAASQPGREAAPSRPPLGGAGWRASQLEGLEPS